MKPTHRCRCKSACAAVAIAAMPLKAEPVTDKLLDALAWAESRNNPLAHGNHGEVGCWQMTYPAIIAVAQWRESMGEIPWIKPEMREHAYHDKSIIRDWLLLCNLWFFKQTGRMPTLAELIATHNAPQLFKKRGFNVNKMPAATKRLVREVEARMK